MVKCPNCGTEVPPLRFCTNCGSPLPQNQQQNDSSPAAPTTTYEPRQTTSGVPFHSQESTPREPDELIQCPLCREKVPKSHSYCYLCGANLHPESIRQHQLVDLKICPRCHKTNPNGVSFCMHCGLVLTPGKKSSITQLLQTSRRIPVMTVEDFNNFELNLIPTPPMDPEMQAQIIKGLTRRKVVDNQIREARVEYSRFFEVPFPGKKRGTLGVLTPFVGMNLIHFLSGWMIIFSLLMGWFLLQQDVFSSIFNFESLLETNPIPVVMLTAAISFFVMLIQFIPSAVAISSFYKKSGSTLQFKLNFQQVTLLIFLNMLISFLGFFPMPVIFRLGMLDFARSLERNKLQKEDTKKLQDSLGDGSLIAMILISIYTLIMILLFGIPGMMSPIITFQLGLSSLNFFFELIMLYGYGFIYFSGFFLIFIFPSMKDFYVQSFMNKHRTSYILSWFILLLILFHFFSLLGNVLLFI